MMYVFLCLPIMQIYYSQLCSIEQQTRQLDQLACPHCQQTRCLISHGYLYRQRHGQPLVTVGKRVFCSNRYQRSGCGRTLALSLDSTVRRLHYAGDVVLAFLLAWMAGATVQQAYFAATTIEDARNAYRWLRRFFEQISTYRSLSHTAPLSLDGTSSHLSSSPPSSPPSLRRALLGSTLTALLARFGTPLCATFQRQLQRAFW